MILRSRFVGILAAILLLTSGVCLQARAATLYVIGQASSPPASGNATTSLGYIETSTGQYTQISSALSTTNSVMNLTYSGTTAGGVNFYVTENSSLASQNLRTLFIPSNNTSPTLSASSGTTGRIIFGLGNSGTDSTLYAYSRTNQDYGTLSTSTGLFSTLTDAAGVTVANAMGGRMAMFGGVNYMVNAQPSGGTAPVQAFGAFNGLTAGSTWSQIGSGNASFQNMVLATDGVKLYGLVPNTSSAAVLYSINTTSGALTLETNVTASGNMPTQFSGAAFAVVPEPSTIALACSGAAAIAVGMRSRRKKAAVPA